MVEIYPQIKQAHVLLALLSGTLFALRGLASLLQAGWPQWLPVRMLSYAIDAALMTAALMLLAILPWSMFGNGWLAVKLLLLVVYIILGSLALRRGRSRRTRAICFTLAVIVFLWMLTIARAHHPLGWLHTFHA